MMNSIFASFMLDFVAKAIHSGLLVVAAHGYLVGDQVTTVESGVGVLITVLVTSILKSFGKKSASSVAPAIPGNTNKNPMA